MTYLLKWLLLVLCCLTISGCLAPYVLTTALYEIPSRYKLNKYYSFSVAVENVGINKEFTGSILCEHHIGFSAGNGWGDWYSSKVSGIVYVDDTENITWQLSGIYCPNNHDNKRLNLPYGLYGKSKEGQIIYFPFLENNNNLFSNTWSLDRKPKYKIYKNRTTIFEPDEHPTGYMYRSMKLINMPEELKSFKTATIIGNNSSRCKNSPLRKFYSGGGREGLFDRFAGEYMQRGLLSYLADSDTWVFEKFKTGYRSINLVGNRKKDFKYWKDDCINLRIENNVYPIGAGEVVWFPDERLLIKIDYLDSSYLQKNMYIDSIKKCVDIPTNILKEIDKYTDFQEILRYWIPDEQKNSQYPVKKHAILMKVEGSVKCVEWPSGSDYMFGW